MVNPGILLLTDADVFAGTERHMLDLARGLRDTGAQVCIGCPVPSVLNDKAPGHGVEVVPIQKGGMIDRAAIGTLRGLLRSKKVDVVHSHNGRTALSAAVAVRMAGRGASVATQHFLEPNRLARRGPAAIASRLAHGWVSSQTSHFLAISEAARVSMLARGDAPAERITVVPNGIADPRMTRLTPPAEIRRELGVDAAAPLIVCAARLEREKDVASLVAAMAQVHAVHPAAVCVVAGEGAEEAGLRAQIRGSGLDGVVRLLGFRADALSVIHAGDLFVLPSLAEPFGLVILEAMALGKAVIATRAGGPKEIIKEGETGLLVEPQNPSALAAALGELLLDPARCGRMGAAGRQRFETHYTAGRMAADTLAIYQQVLAREREGNGKKGWLFSL